jgi:hypothetical protein
MSQTIKNPGTSFGMGLSSISSLHLFLKGFARDRNYFLRMSGQQLLIFRGSVRRPRRQTIHENSLANLRNKNKTEGISSAVRRKIMKYIDAWFTTIEYAKTTGTEDKLKIKKHLAMLTLTLPVRQQHDDKYLKRYALMMFIKNMTRQFKTINYLWKAETQKNGNIHFHIIIDEYVEKEKIDSWWKNRMNLLGYEQQYENETGKKNPPMCNVETLRNKNNAGAYVAKYFTKNEDRREIEGRCWGCSDKIKNLANPEMSVNETELDECLRIVNMSISSIYVTDYCVIMKNVQNLENLIHKGLDNYTFKDTLVKNTHELYSYQYDAFSSQPETEWERDIIKEVGHLNALYLFENDMIGY